MKAKRLARLMRDSDAQLWLDLETRGYPDGFAFSSLGTCRKYAISGNRFNPEAGNYYHQSLPTIEANVISDAAMVDAFRSDVSPNTTVENYLAAGATKALMATRLEVQNARRKAYGLSAGLFSALKSGIHGFATDTYLAIELGDVAEDIFENARKDIDTFVRSYCPKAAEKLVAINERMADNSSESRTAALTSCRRLLMDVADSLFPPRDEGWKDANGKTRKVGSDQYKNRLLAYISERTQSLGSRAVIESELDHLAARLDAIYEKACKGVHIDVSEQEARLAVIHTYLFVGEVAQFSLAPVGVV
jgi:hypothetical protein